MSVPTGTAQVLTLNPTGVGSGAVRENLINAVYNVDPIKTPTFNMAKKAEAKSDFYEWNIDALAAVNASNAAVEGDNPTNTAITPTARLGNYTQIFTKTIQLSGTSQAVVAAGGVNTMGYQLQKKSKEIKRDIESSLTSNVARAAGTSSTARFSAGMQTYLATNFVSVATTPGTAPSGTSSAGGSTFGNGTTTRTAGTGLNAVTETAIRTALLDIYTTSGESPDYIICSPKNKQNISFFTGGPSSGYTRFNEIEDEVLMTAVDEYEHDFGRSKIIPDIFLATSGSILLLNSNYFRVSYLRPFMTIPLAKTGDSDQKELLVELCLECSNEHAHGIVADTNG